MSIDPIRVLLDPAYRTLQLPWLLTGALTGQTQAIQERLGQVGFQLETGEPGTGGISTSTKIIAGILASLGIIGASAVAISDRLSRVRVEIQEKKPEKKKRFEFLKKIPKKYKDLILALGGGGVTAGLFALLGIIPPTQPPIIEMEEVKKEPPLFGTLDISYRPRREPPEPTVTPPTQEIPEPPPGYRGIHR